MTGPYVVRALRSSSTWRRELHSLADLCPQSLSPCLLAQFFCFSLPQSDFQGLRSRQFLDAVSMKEDPRGHHLFLTLCEPPSMSMVAVRQQEHSVVVDASTSIPA